MFYLLTYSLPSFPHSLLHYFLPFLSFYRLLFVRLFISYLITCLLYGNAAIIRYAAFDVSVPSPQAGYQVVQSEDPVQGTTAARQAPVRGAVRVR